MTIQQKQEGLINALIHYGFPKKYFIQTADKRLGHKFAIASNTEHGGIDVHSSYMNYEEFNYYLKGYYDAKSRKF